MYHLKIFHSYGKRMKLNGSLIGKLTLICKIFMRYMCFVSKNKISEMKLGYSCAATVKTTGKKHCRTSRHKQIFATSTTT